MPSLLYEDGFRIFFYANDSNEPMHVHVERQGRVAKFWIKPLALARNNGMKVNDLRAASDLVIKHEELIKEKWDEFFSPKK